jgi:hypothetical protein
MAANRPTTDPEPASISGLLELFGARWKIVYESALNVWSAELRSSDGWLGFICDRSPAVLTGKLAAAESATAETAGR